MRETTFPCAWKENDRYPNKEGEQDRNMCSLILVNITNPNLKEQIFLSILTIIIIIIVIIIFGHTKKTNPNPNKY